MDKGVCRHPSCSFAHGEHELRKPSQQQQQQQQPSKNMVQQQQHQQQQQQQQQQLSCNMCNKTFNGEAQKREHLASKGHKQQQQQQRLWAQIQAVVADFHHACDGEDMPEAMFKMAFEQKYDKSPLEQGQRVGKLMAACPGVYRLQPPGKTHWMLWVRDGGNGPKTKETVVEETGPSTTNRFAFR